MGRIPEGPKIHSNPTRIKVQNDMNYVGLGSGSFQLRPTRHGHELGNGNRFLVFLTEPARCTVKSSKSHGGSAPPLYGI